MSRLKSSTSSKSDREIVMRVQPVLAMASVDRSERSKMAISPKQAPGFRTARASSPDPGMVREMRTSPSEMMNRRLPGSPSLKMCCPTANFCSRQHSATRASSPSSSSWKIAACFSRWRSTRSSYVAREGRASETVGDVGRSAYGASRSARRRVSVRASPRRAAGSRGGRRCDGFLRRDAGAPLRELAGWGGARSRRGQALHGRGVSDGGALGPAAPARDRGRPGARHRGGARVPRRVDRAAPGDAARAGRRQGRHRMPVAHARGFHRGLAVRAPLGLGYRGDRPVCHLGLQPRGHARRSVRHPRSGGGAGGGGAIVRRTAWVATLLVLSAAGLAAQSFLPPPVKQAAGRGTRIGLFGFSVRSGPDVSHGGQLVLGAGLDGGDLFSRRLRVRPSVEVGVFNGPNTYVASLEALYRFTADDETAVPYAGGGLSIAGHDGCGGDAACPALWANAVVGFELRYRSTFNWLFEYHAMDAFRRHRIYFGLTTRRGN